MGIKIFSPGGIDQKSSNLVRKPEMLRDAQNIQKNINGEYVKRPGSGTDADFGYPTLSPAPYVFNDAVYIRSMNCHFFRDGSNYYKKNDNENIVSVYKWADPTSDGTSNISFAEYLNTAIFTHEEGQYFTAKFDGRSVYKAGLPTPEISVTGLAGSIVLNTNGEYYILSFYEFVDAQGNTVYGPASINRIDAPSFAGYNLSVGTFNGSGFYGGYINVTQAGSPGSPYIINSSNLTLNYSSASSDFSTTLAPGTKVVIRSNEAGVPSTSGTAKITVTDSVNNLSVLDSFALLEIASVTATTITFTADSVGTKSISIDSYYGPNILGSLRLRCFLSTSETTGYFEGNVFDNVINNTGTSFIVTYSGSSSLNSVMLSNIYDITTDKLRPPRCKYILSYGYQLIYAPALSFWDFENKETTYTNNDLVMYSDISTGDLGENLTASNRQLIGDTYDGEITGMVRSKDSVIVFKDRSPYALDGVLIPGQYSMRKIETDDIGCLSSKSIIAVDDKVLFQGQDGIYATNGYKCVKLSLPVDVFFRSTVADPSLTRSLVYTAGNKYLFFCDNGIAAYDYELDEWFIWNGISAPRGLTVDNSNTVRMFQSNRAQYLIEGSLNDVVVSQTTETSPIDAWIKTAWFDLGEPSVLKKATDIRLFALNNAGQTLQLEYFADWSETNGKQKGPYSVDFSDSDTKTVLKKLDIIQGHAISFKISNNVANEDLNLTGFEITCGVAQTKDKNA